MNRIGKRGVHQLFDKSQESIFYPQKFWRAFHGPFCGNFCRLFLSIWKVGYGIKLLLGFYLFYFDFVKIL